VEIFLAYIEKRKYQIDFPSTKKTMNKIRHFHMGQYDTMKLLPDVLVFTKRKLECTTIDKG